MPYDPGNIFAKILRGEIPSVKVYEDDKTLAFMDVMPEADGHVLVIPREGAENILDLSPQGMAAMMDTVQKLARAVDKAPEEVPLKISPTAVAANGKTTCSSGPLGPGVARCGLDQSDGITASSCAASALQTS